MAVDVLFIHPGNQKKTYQDLSKEYTAIATPVWAALIADYLRNRDIDTAIFDVNIEGWDENDPQAIASSYDPDLIVLMVYGHNPSASTQTMPAAGRIARDIKKYNRDIPVAMGGIHPSALPEKTLQEEEIDFVIQGEGPYTVYDLINALKGKSDLKDARGLWYLKEGLPSFSTPAPNISNLDDELGSYAWDLLPSLTKYRAHNMHCFQDFYKSETEDFSDIRSPYVSMNTSLGCPYSCSYCCINAIFGKPRINYWSLDTVMTWMDTLYNEYGVKNVRFDDELFILSSERVEKFCNMIIDRGYDMNFWVYGRVDTIKDSLLKKMKKAGINWICLGIESGNENVREGVNKKIKKDIKEVVSEIQANGIYVLGNYMFGLPDDDLHTMEETLKLAMELNCEYANFYTVMAYPGSQLYNQAAKRPDCLPPNWGGYSQLSYETMPLPTKNTSAGEVLRFRDEAFYRYHTNPVYLSMIEEKFGAPVRRHIEKMLDVKIKRKL